jgi:ribonuclease HI
VKLGAEEVTCNLDSQLVVKQVVGEYHVRNTELRRLWRKVQELRGSFKEAIFLSVPRTDSQIQKADSLVNNALDEQFG